MTTLNCKLFNFLFVVQLRMFGEFLRVVNCDLQESIRKEGSLPLFVHLVQEIAN